MHVIGPILRYLVRLSLKTISWISSIISEEDNGCHERIPSLADLRTLFCNTIKLICPIEKDRE